jgi:GT2 family glycosyltransferase
MHKDKKIIVVIPNWNGGTALRGCIQSLEAQSLKPHIIMVDNGSVDESVALVEKHFPEVEIIRHDRNKGYAGGVNPGFRRALELEADYVAPFNNDAVADRRWLETMVRFADNHLRVGIVTCKLLSAGGDHIDSTGDYYTDWGLPYPRGRGESDINAYDSQTEIFGASGGASLYRVSMLREVGLLDEDFFAYYEDVDLSFRAQLYGWKVAYVPESVVYHEMSVTGKRIKGFFTYQTVKNYPWLLWKNVPASLLPKILPRLTLAQILFIGRAFSRGHGWYALKALAVSTWLLPKKLIERHHIQTHRKVTPEYIWSIMTHDLPPNAHNLRKLRAAWWKIKGRKSHE